MTKKAAARPPDAVRRGLATVAMVRISTLPLTIGGSLVSAWIIVHDVGAEGYATVALVTSLILLVPFADLGISAPVVNAIAAGREDRARTVRLAWNWLWSIALVWSLIVVALDRVVGWDRILGADVNASMVTTSLLIFALSIPFGIGYRLLVGLGRVALASGLQGTFPVVTICLTLVGYLSGRPEIYLLTPATAQLGTAVLTFIVARRAVGEGFSWSWGTLGSRREAVRLLGGGVPMLVISIGLAAALQSHRLVLSHESTHGELTRYALAVTFYAPVWGLASTVGMQLWSYFASSRASAGPDMRRLFAQRWIEFVAMGVVLALVLLVAGPVLARHLYGSDIPFVVWGALAILLVVQCAHLPAGMFLTENTELARQAAGIVPMAAVSVLVSLWTARLWGAPGPILASAFAIACCQLVPGLVMVIRRSGTPRASSGAED